MSGQGRGDRTGRRLCQKTCHPGSVKSYHIIGCCTECCDAIGYRPPGRAKKLTKASPARAHLDSSMTSTALSPAADWTPSSPTVTGSSVGATDSMGALVLSPASYVRKEVRTIRLIRANYASTNNIAVTIYKPLRSQSQSHQPITSHSNFGGMQCMQRDTRVWIRSSSIFDNTHDHESLSPHLGCQDLCDFRIESVPLDRLEWWRRRLPDGKVFASLCALRDTFFILDQFCLSKFFDIRFS